MIHEVSSDYPIGDRLCQGRQVDIIDGSHTLIDVSYPCVSPAYGCIVASGHCPGPTSMAASSSMATADESSVFVVKKGKDGPACQHFVRMVNNPSDRSPTYKISKELFQIPHKMAEISKLSAALKQLCMYLKYNNMQGRKQLNSGNYAELPGWVNYWIRSGVSPLILLAGCVYSNKRHDAALSDPNFIFTTIDSLRNMYDGTWGRIAVDGSMLRAPIVDFVAKCHRFMTAWCTKAMGGEGSSEGSTIIGEYNSWQNACSTSRWRT